MTTKVEISPRRQLNYTWKIKDINREEPHLFSKKFTNQNIELLRVGIKVPGKISSSNRPLIVFLMTANQLQKLGLKILSVFYFKFSKVGTTNWRVQEIEVNQKDLTDEGIDDEAKNVGIQLFAAPLNLLENDETDLTFMITVNFTGIVDNYHVQQMDGLLSQQLQISIKNQENWASFKLIADGKSYRVHKWMLAARSPVFAALFSSYEEIGSIHLAVDCSVNEIGQFIQFIYTGKLTGLVSHELMQLAAKYEIKTLQEVCEAALLDASSMDKMAVAAFHLDSGSHVICNERKEPDEELSEIKRRRIDVSMITCTWNVQNLGAEENQEPIKRSVSFQHEGKKLFRAWLEMKKSPNRPGKYTFSALKFLSHGHESICSKIYQVTCSIDGPDQNSSTHQRILMTKTEPKDNKTSLQVFSSILSATELTAPFSCPFVITFHAKLESTVAHFINILVDLTFSEQLWAAAIDRKMTDVEILVGEDAFGAHRSLISARSPVFSAMFASGMKEAETGQVRIEDVDPTTFQHFLKFLYTGMLEPWAVDEKLFVVADKYGVETLMELCRPATQPADTEDDILKAFFLSL